MSKSFTPSKSQPKVPEKKGFNPEDFVTMTIPL